MAKKDLINEFIDKLSDRSALDNSVDLTNEINAKQAELNRLNAKRNINDRKIFHSLALIVQDTIPVHIRLTSNACHFTYRSRDLEVKIDWANSKWVVNGNSLIHRRFIREIKDVPLSNDGIILLAQQIVDYFGGRYRTLQSKSPDKLGEKIDIDEVLKNGEL